ncbi:MAG: hypothetical protein CO094_00970 [Anaerolineae bacterium CG_4_9_14_3_um_filter_57_17]|nr:hypothetical protein [bacterium]NCT21859.1 hypothetical protein [bacterium]OIO86080.1 MAG: hypothetical protein AUK01_04425 [Anaerolineae bacterium CG2_30_57_67]PJB68505.1 MAG: hypothetical protein CO094_00970 [Anaerolineae bacterium CG_4_9_14_3_um_filter_57_17]
MEKAETEAWIIEQLAKNAPESDIVLRLTQKAGLYWPDAEALVREVAARNAVKIERKQMPLLVTLALLIFSSGIGLIVYGMSPFLMMFTGERAMPLNGATLMMALFQLGAQFFWPTITGAGMVFGSLIGMRRVWSNFLNDL